MTFEEKIIDLLELTNFEKTFLSVRDGMLSNLNVEIEDSEMFERAMSFVIKEFKKEDFVQISVEIYKDFYTEEEVDHLYQFYQTEVGQQICQKQPTVGRAIMDRTQILVHNMLEKLPAYLDDTI